MEVTPEMRQAVREEECSVSGHRLDAILADRSNEPVKVVCTNCGRSWEIAT